MGYTHYWYKEKKDHTQKEWAKFVCDCIDVLHQLPKEVELTGNEEIEEEGPIFDQFQIRFNGIGSEAHETFMLTRKLQKDDTRRPYTFDFCKTAMKPYDIMVTACLILYKYHFPKQVWVSSDGDLDDWKEAFALIATALPHGKEVGTTLMLAEEIFEPVPGAA